MVTPVLALALLTATQAHVREAKAVVPVGFIEMVVATVMPVPDGHTVVLVNTEEEVLLPVSVLLPEAVTIYGRLEQKKALRPMTHDLLDDVVKALGARVLRVQIEDIKDGTFIGTIVMQEKARTFALDAGAADALAIALSTHAPIFVSKVVMDRAALTHEQLKHMPGARRNIAEPAMPPSPEGKARVFDL